MSAIYFICEFLASFIESFICYRFCGLFIKEKMKNRDSLFLALALTTVLSFENGFKMVTAATLITAIVFVSITCRLHFKINLFTALCVTLFYSLILNFFDFFSISILKHFFDIKNFENFIIKQESFYRLLALFVSKSLLLLSFVIIQNVLKDRDKVRTQNLLIITGLGYTGFFYFVYSLFVDSNLNVTVMGLSFLMVIVFALFSFIAYARYKEEREEKKIIELSNLAFAEKYNEILTIYNNNAELYHNMNNNIGVLKNLMQGSRYEEAERYLDSMSDFPTAFHSVWTGNEMIDCIINLKKEICEQNEIKIVIDVDLIKKAEIDNFIMCTIISNLLDNAIEASIRNPIEKWIYIAIRRINDIIIIKTENPVTEAMEKNLKGGGELPPTSKKDKRNHGWGMKSVVDSVKRADGSFSYSVNNHKFSAVAALFL